MSEAYVAQTLYCAYCAHLSTMVVLDRQTNSQVAECTNPQCTHFQIPYRFQRQKIQAIQLKADRRE